MCILHSSNKTENLVAHLTAVIKNALLASPFAKDVFLIQGSGYGAVVITAARQSI
ncbi:hypothetical protein ABXJ76_00205 [Methylobacter sp. G7]|uniref:hypothetical protein n=1 Tax=Methylobacter sp. G7 TaxID=3230117 RepID=UPI003D807168